MRVLISPGSRLDHAAVADSVIGLRSSVSNGAHLHRVVMMGAGLSISIMALIGGYLIAALGYTGLFLTGAGLTAVGALLFRACFGMKHKGLVRVAQANRKT